MDGISSQRCRPAEYGQRNGLRRLDSVSSMKLMYRRKQPRLERLWGAITGGLVAICGLWLRLVFPSLIRF